MHVVIIVIAVTCEAERPLIIHVIASKKPNVRNIYLTWHMEYQEKALCVILTLSVWDPILDVNI